MRYQISKIKSYVGFAIRSREIKYGIDDIMAAKGSKLILISKSLAESSYNKLGMFAKNNNISLILLESDEFAELVQSENIKAIAILNKGLADAIKKNLAN